MTFEKLYSRQSTLIVQEVWMQTFLVDVPEKFGDTAVPRPALLIDCADGIIEIWVRKEANTWIVANAGRAYGQDLELVRSKVAEYQGQLSELMSIWAIPETTVAGFKGTLQKTRVALANWLALFYVITSEDSLQSARDLALELRARDTFFVDAEIYIQKTLAALLPGNEDLTWYVTMADLAAGIDPATLRARREKYLFVDGIPQGAISLHEYVQDHTDIVLVDPAKEAQMAGELKGQIAQKGKVSGRVRVLKKREQVASVQEGEILVSTMTTPDFLPAMRRAAAFVTDEGGITCHAAIVSRELKKPCIIGTKVATKVLKDGDEVEVDAEKGVVRILKRA